MRADRVIATCLPTSGDHLIEGPMGRTTYLSGRDSAGGPTVRDPDEFNNTTHHFPRSKCLPDLLRERARAHPDATAIIHEDESLSFRELAHRSSALAAYLRHLGLARDDCVGIFVEPSVDLMVGVWGILFAGCAYLPLSPEYPEDRLRYMIEDSGTRVIVCQEGLRTGLTDLAPHGTRIITPAEAADLAASNSAVEKQDINLRPTDLAYIIYTSGSTGRPKGVMIEHRSIVNQMHWLKIVYRLNRESIVLQKTPMSFDAAQWEILAPSCGSRVVLGSPGVYRDPERLVETIIRHNITTLQCVPTLLQALLDVDDFHKCTSLRQIFSGGEALSKNLALHIVKALPECDLVNLYGPTECTINSSAFTVDPNSIDSGAAQTISIGAPVYNTRYHILDDRLSPVAVGETGELYIGGVQLARGYLGQPGLTAQRFIDRPSSRGHRRERLYRTGDLAYWTDDGTVQFVGRTDNQVKLRGFRVELDEIRLAIEAHDWIRNAAVVVRTGTRTGRQNLTAFIELNPNEATLMDQGNHGAHHQSKEGRLQTRAQLSNMGCRDATELVGKTVVDLPGKVPAPHQRQQVFARKTYRFFEGGAVRRSDILKLLESRVAGSGSRRLDALAFAEFGEILRYFGQYISGERLLPKYGYASPGALYATQMYLEIHRFGDLPAGYYYYHPMHHHLVLIGEASGPSHVQIKIHFVGKKRAIEPVYKNNIREVLEIEAGHMVGLFEAVLPRYGLSIAEVAYLPGTMDHLECAGEDYYLGTFEIVPNDGPRPAETLDIYVQSHPGKIADLPPGMYHYKDGALNRISTELVLRRHVIAINQQVYDRSSLGITLVGRGRSEWLGYIDLGRRLQRLQMNSLNLGFMSSGYSSKTGHSLPAAVRMESILKACGRDRGPSYFFVGGRVSDGQLRSEGMREDIVHMKGPAEMIKADLVNLLPDYMVPHRVVVVDRLPLTANGKVDLRALATLETADPDVADRPALPPRTKTEARIGDIWKKEMKADTISVRDDFFELGGNSLIAVALINRINREFGSALPLQVLFEASTIEQLAVEVDRESAGPPSRLVRLGADGSRGPVYCWPGLGGYTMNLRLLASKMARDRPFYGVQAHGINENETPYSTIKEMAAEDIKLIRRLQPDGPYTLWGYSFGARVAFETAHQLERSGDRVENLFLIAPGSPRVRTRDAAAGEPNYRNNAYLTILFSVFTGSVSGGLLRAGLKVARDDESFASFIHERYRNLDIALIKRIVQIVHRTYQFTYTFHELAQRRIAAPITIFKARGDDYSFLENSSGYSAETPTVVDLRADHYGMLKEPGVGELVARIHHRLRSIP